jgi:hypothetical protein
VPYSKIHDRTLNTIDLIIVYNVVRGIFHGVLNKLLLNSILWHVYTIYINRLIHRRNSVFLREFQEFNRCCRLIWMLVYLTTFFLDMLWSYEKWMKKRRTRPKICSLLICTYFQILFAILHNYVNLLRTEICYLELNHTAVILEYQI